MIRPRPCVLCQLTILSQATTTPSTFDRPNRLKGREDGGIKWNELLDKFRAVQEKARRQQRMQGEGLSDIPPGMGGGLDGLAAGGGIGVGGDAKTMSDNRLLSQTLPLAQSQSMPASGTTATASHTKSKSSFSRLGGAVADARRKVRR